MAIKVVSKKPVQTKELVCEGCGYRLQYTKSDTRTMQDCYSSSAWTKWLQCPRKKCKHFNILATGVQK